MSQPSNWIITFAALSSLGALMNAFTAIINRYDARMKTIKDLLAARAESINKKVENDVVDTNKTSVMAVICNQAMQAENDIKEARKIPIIKFFCCISRSDIQKELRSYFYTLLHGSLQDFFSKGEGRDERDRVIKQIDILQNIYKDF